MPITHVRREHVIIEDVITAITCDACGRVDNTDRYDRNFNIIRVSGGYSSVYPPDTVSMEIVTCGPCLKKWVESFKHVPDQKSWGSPAPVGDVLVEADGGPARVEYGFLLFPGEVCPQGVYWEEWDLEEWGLSEEAFLQRSALEDTVMTWPKVYRHFKNGLHYEVEDIVVHLATRTKYVLYRELYGESRRWVRPLEAWFQGVEHNGETVSRFSPVPMDRVHENHLRRR
jgi:hypothetical protein